MLFKNQTFVDIEIETGVPLVNATLRKIVMTKPDNSRVELSCSYAGTKLIYNNLANENIFNLAGIYRFQGIFKLDGRDGKGLIITQVFHNPL